MFSIFVAHIQARRTMQEEGWNQEFGLSGLSLAGRTELHKKTSLEQPPPSPLGFFPLPCVPKFRVLPRQDQRGTDLANHLCATRLAPEKSIKQVGQDRRLSALIRLKGV